MRDELKSISKKAQRLSDALEAADRKTLRALEDVSTKLVEEASSRALIDYLNAAGLVEQTPPLPMAVADLAPMLAAIHFIRENANAKATQIDAVMREHGHKQPPRGYKTQSALYTLVGNICRYWLDAVGAYTRLFDDYDADTDGDAQIPLNPASKFTVQCVQLIAPEINNPTIAKAMQECITHHVSPRRAGEK